MIQFHPVTALFPAIEGQPLEDLAIDIDLHGQHEPCWTYEGQVIDGRNRCRAIEIANRWRREREQPLLTPRFREWPGGTSLVAFAMSLNLHRRHLTESQRGLMAAKAAAMMEEEARQRQLEALKKGNERPSLSRDNDGKYTGRTCEKAAAMANVSPSTVARAQKVLKNGGQPLIEAVETGKVKVTQAAEWVGKKPAEILRLIKIEGEQARRENAKADLRDVFDRMGKLAEKIRRQCESCDPPLAKLQRSIEKHQELQAEECARLLG